MYKKYLKQTAIYALITLCFVGAVNYIVDPLWLFSHKNTFNKWQLPFNERQQKVNYIAFNDIAVDFLIVGTSRTININHTSFLPFRAFNLSLSSAAQAEYYDYIDYFKKHNKKKLSYIMLEMFPSLNDSFKENQKRPQYYMEEANHKFHHLKTIFSVSTFAFSLRNIMVSVLLPKLDEVLVYTRDQIAFSSGKGFNKKKVEKLYYEDPGKQSEYKYDGSYKELLERLKNQNSDISILPIIPPFSAPRIVKLMKSKEYQKFYREWLIDVVDVFGKVYDFNRVNSVTGCLDNYRDTHHFLPNVGDMIAKRIMQDITGEKQEVLPNDFGVLITKKNLKKQLNVIFDENNLKKPNKIICQY